MYDYWTPLYTTIVYPYIQSLLFWFIFFSIFFGLFLTKCFLPIIFKSFFINLQTVDHVFADNGFAESNEPPQNGFQQAQDNSTFGQPPAQSAQANQNAQQPQNGAFYQANEQPAQQQAQSNQPTQGQAPAGSAGDYVVKFGAQSGKKLSEIDPEIVRVFTDMDGEIQEKASEYLNSIGA